jgi:hypothetical protein
MNTANRWRMRYFAIEVMAQPDRRGIDVPDVNRALSRPAGKRRQLDGRVRHWYWVTERRRWLRVVTEADGETVHNTFWDRNFDPCRGWAAAAVGDRARFRTPGTHRRGA